MSGFQKFGALYGSPNNEDHGILGSVLEPPFLGNFHAWTLFPKSIMQGIYGPFWKASFRGTWALQGIAPVVESALVLCPTSPMDPHYLVPTVTFNRFLPGRGVSKTGEGRGVITRLHGFRGLTILAARFAMRTESSCTHKQ